MDAYGRPGRHPSAFVVLHGPAGFTRLRAHKTGQLLSWMRSDGQSCLVHLLTVACYMAEMTRSGLMIGDLIIHHFRRAGETILPDLLQAMLVRMETAQTTTSCRA
jgi:hypothetical protein